MNNATVIVNSITYNSPTQVTLNLNTVGAAGGLRDLTITNPDGQVVTRTDIINILVPTAAPANLAGRVVDASGRGVSNVTIRLASSDGDVDLLTRTNSFGFYRFHDVMTGQSYVLTPTHKRYVFDPESLPFSHLDETTNVDFLALAPKRQ